MFGRSVCGRPKPDAGASVALGAVPRLTPADEVALARRIEAADAQLQGLLLRSVIATKELARIAGQLQRGELEPWDVVVCARPTTSSHQGRTYDALLRALVEVPPFGRSQKVQETIHTLGEFLADGDLRHANYPTPKGQISKHWFQFSFPRSYHSDILEAMVALDAAGYVGDQRLRPAVDFIAEQRKPLKRQGQKPIDAWKSAHVLTGKTLVNLDWRSRGGPSKWITFLALSVLKDWSSLPE